MWRASQRVIVLFLSGAMLGEVLFAFQREAIGSPLEASSPRSFVVYDGTLYHSKPDLSQFGLKRLKVIYVSEFGERWYSGPTKMQLPHESDVKHVASTVASTEKLAAIDIEHWSVTGEPTIVQESLVKYSTIAKWFHEVAPSMEIGFFGIVPMAAYGWSLKGSESVEYKSWQQINATLIPLAEKVDVIFPYLYTYHPNQAAWVQSAKENLKEAHRYGKPVYVFLWPQYTDQAGSFAGKAVPQDYWAVQLETVRTLADGVVIWGGWGKNGPEPWNEDAPWWKVTKRFMQQINSKHPTPPGNLTVR